ncbi:hypothetical protein JH06_3340 [Blastocystis sp. subtype 4]|uniref:hypothetical protein n=1 Tax=Blastocystis sp. subtype 4 TaxID=944170 RepID=UPI0007120FAC|nr:hypothetical protein JH06_3340 [Blastocystis sp. subtype 4]KNB43380.1 hypothetical protein JH06_3340 [Blastocystis sp. subtype 4]|eukprot:XP_014526817.1 hypothetical protein JH06_3340 [Blastocystis sp. subtype 4]
MNVVIDAYETRVLFHVLNVQSSELEGLPESRSVFQKKGDVFFLSDRRNVQEMIKSILLSISHKL